MPLNLAILLGEEVCQSSLYSLSRTPGLEFRSHCDLRGGLLPLALAPLNQTNAHQEFAVIQCRTCESKLLESTVIVERSPVVVLSYGQVRLSLVGGERHRNICRLPRPPHSLLCAIEVVPVPQRAYSRQARCRHGKRRVQLESPRVHSLGKPVALRTHRAIVVVVATKIEVVRLEVVCRPDVERFSLRFEKRDSKRSHDTVGDGRLDREDRREIFVVYTCPHMTGVGDIDQLRADSYAARAVLPVLPTDRRLQQVIDGEFISYLLRRLWAVLVLHGALPRNNGQACYASEARGDLVGDAIGKVFILRRSEILERQYRKADGVTSGGSTSSKT